MRSSEPKPTTPTQPMPKREQPDQPGERTRRRTFIQPTFRVLPAWLIGLAFLLSTVNGYADPRSLKTPVYFTAAAPSNDDAYHVMWTNAKGQQKCINKKNREKADRCAEKIRSKDGVSNVQVMVGRCADM